MSPLRAEPTGIVETVPQLIALAANLSRQAIDLYRDLGSRMAELGNESARRAFADIEAMQREHAGAFSDLGSGEAPEVFYGEDLEATRLVTPYMAYSLAVRNEERAFAFWSYVSAHATDPAVQSEAERLAHVEMDHVRVLRARRRRAYQEGSGLQPSQEWLRTASLPDFRQEAARREAALASLHERIATALAAAGEALASDLAAIARKEAESARDLGGGTEAAEEPELPSGEPKELLAFATEQLEAVVELYLTVAERSRREEVVAAAQELSHHGIGRLSRLR